MNEDISDGVPTHIDPETDRSVRIELPKSECKIGFDNTGVGGWCVTHHRWLCPLAGARP